MNIQAYVPTMLVEGEVVTEPLRTTVTRIFYGRVAIKIAPFVLLLLWLYFAGGAIIASLLTIVVLFFVVSIFVPQLGGLGSLGSGAIRMVGSLISGASDVLDGVVGPNKGQLPVLLLDIQSLDQPTQPTTVGTRVCTNVMCGHENQASAAHCIACGTDFEAIDATAATGGPRRRVVRIEGQIVGGEPRLGHRVALSAFDHKGTLLFISGTDKTTGAEIQVRRTADTGTQH